MGGGLRKVYHYYGMCGTLKATTIKTLLTGSRVGYTLPVWSLPKPWKRLEGGALEGMIEKGNNMNLAALSLCTLEHTLMTAAVDEDIEFLLCERGVLDNLFYWSMSHPELSAEETQSVIKKVREEEKRILESYGWKEIRNTVLVMEDEEFIEKVVLSEPTRRAWFPDVNSYLRKQEDYLRFIWKWTEGNCRERRIVSARDYIEKELKLKYNV